MTMLLDGLGIWVVVRAEADAGILLPPAYSVDPLPFIRFPLVSISCTI